MKHSKRGGVTPDINRVMPKKIQNERDRRTEERKSIEPIVQAIPDLSPY